MEELAFEIGCKVGDQLEWSGRKLWKEIDNVKRTMYFQLEEVNVG